MIPAARVDRLLFAFAALAALAYLLLLGAHPYPGGTILKSSTCLLLALLVARHRNWVLCTALGCSALGDALLSIDGARLFVPALASFLVTHLLYAAIFVSRAQLPFLRLSMRRKLLLVAVLLFAVTYSMTLWPQLGDLALPVVVYIAAIVAMTLLSLRMSVVWVPIGALLFLASDSLIALSKFLWQAEWLGPAIWITYALAQLCIVSGVLAATTAPGRV